MNKKLLVMGLAAITAHGDGLEVSVSTGVSINNGGKAKALNNAYDTTKDISQGVVFNHLAGGVTEQDITK